VEDYLNRNDNQCMANSVEGRVPLLDQYLVEFAFQLSSRSYLRNNDKKYLLKKVAEKHLPKDFIYRPKRGFTAPILKWLDSTYNNGSYNNIRDFNHQYRVFNSKFLTDFFIHHQKSKINPSAFWSIINLTVYLNEF